MKKKQNTLTIILIIGFIGFFMLVFYIDYQPTVITLNTESNIEITNNDEVTPNNYAIWKSSNDEEYLHFLNTIDKKGYELIAVSYNKGIWYVTYKVNNVTEETEKN